MDVTDKFYTDDVQPLKKEIHNSLEDDFQTHKDEWKGLFIASVKDAAAIINKRGIEKPGYIAYHLLRTNIMAKKYKYSVNVYDDMYIINPEINIGEFDVGYIYKYYEEMERRLKKEYKKYVMKISEPEVEMIMLGELNLFHKYVVETMRYGLIDALETEEYKSVEKAEQFEIHSGEYFEPCDVIHMETQNKKYGKLKQWLEKHEGTAYVNCDFKGIQIEGDNYQNIDLRYADFREGNLNGVNLSLSLLIGTKFKNSQMQKINLIASNVSDANFENADMSDANLRYIVSLQGKNAANDWKTVGFTGTNFKNSNLAGANFSDAAIIGADFRGANIKGADFTNAGLYRSVFCQNQLRTANLSKEQISQIIIGKEG